MPLADYIKTVWTNLTSINVTRLNNIENSLDAAVDAIIALQVGSFAPERIASGTPAAGKYPDGTGVWTVLPAGGGGSVTFKLSPDRGDANVTLTLSDLSIQQFATALTAIRAVTLPSPATDANAFFRIVRRGTATGNFGLEVRLAGGGLLYTLTAPNTWIDVYWDGTGWMVVHPDYEAVDNQYLLRAGDVGVGRIRVTNPTPISTDELAAKSYVDSIVGGHGFIIPANNATLAQYYFLGTTRLQSNTTRDKIFFRLDGGQLWEEGKRITQGIIPGINATTDTAVPAFVEKRGTQAAGDQYGIRGFKQTDGSVNYYLYFAANTFIGLREEMHIMKFGDGGNTFSRIVPQAPVTTTPVGDLIFNTETFV